MNASYLVLLTSIVGLALFFYEKTGEPPVVSTSPPATFEKSTSAWAESDFTDWKSRAELQYLQDSLTPGQYFAHVEGRNNHGRLEYRAVLRPFPSDAYQQWAVFWGIDEAELFNWELRLLRAGFERKQMQVFADSSGKSIHQIVWLQPAGSTKVVELSSSTQVPVSSPDLGDKDPQPTEQPVIALDPPSEDKSPSPPPKPITPPETPPEPPKPLVAVSKTYTIQPGDTVEKIARHNRISIAALKSANGLKSSYLHSGKKLVIPAPN